MEESLRWQKVLLMLNKYLHASNSCIRSFCITGSLLAVVFTIGVTTARAQRVPYYQIFKGATEGIANPVTKTKCEGACGSDQRGMGSFQSCVHECYWETDKWKNTCGGNRYC